MKSVHPSVDSPRKTFVTDQDKGSILAFNEVFEHVAQFMCSFHRPQREEGSSPLFSDVGLQYSQLLQIYQSAQPL